MSDEQSVHGALVAEIKQDLQNMLRKLAIKAVVEVAIEQVKAESKAVCPYCLKPSDDCDCCDADVSWDMGDSNG